MINIKKTIFKVPYIVFVLFIIGIVLSLNYIIIKLFYIVFTEGVSVGAGFFITILGLLILSLDILIYETIDNSKSLKEKIAKKED